MTEKEIDEQYPILADKLFRMTKLSIMLLDKRDNYTDDRCFIMDYCNEQADNKDDQYFYESLTHVKFILEGATAYTTPDKVICLNYPIEPAEMIPMDKDRWRRWYFTFCHECLHQMWDTFNVADEIVKKYGSYDHRLLNIASDCVINDYLANIHPAGKLAPNGIITPDVIRDKYGVDFDRKTDTQFTLYEKIMKIDEKLQKDMKDKFGDDEQQGQGNQSNQQNNQNQPSASDARNAANEARKAADKARKAADEARKAAERGNDDLAKDAAKDAADATKEAADATKDIDKDASNNAQKAADNANKTADDSKTSAQDAADAAEKAAQAAEEAANAAEQAAQEAESREKNKGKGPGGDPGNNKGPGGDPGNNKGPGGDPGDGEGDGEDDGEGKGKGKGKGKDGEGESDGTGDGAGDGDGDLMAREMADLEKACKADFEKILKKYRDQLSGDFGEFISKCKASKVLKPTGLAEAVKGGGSWNKEVFLVCKQYMQQKLKAMKRYKPTYNRLRRGERAFTRDDLKNGRIIVQGREEIKDKIGFDVAVYIDVSGSMDSVIDKVFDAAYTICKNLKTDIGKDKMVDRDKINLKSFVFTTKMREIKFGQHCAATGGTYQFGDLIHDIHENGSDAFINLIVTDGDFNGVNEQQIIKEMKDFKGLVVLVTNNQSESQLKMFKKLANDIKVKLGGTKMSVIQADSNFTVS